MINGFVRWITFLIAFSSVCIASAAEYPQPVESDYTINDFRFRSGERLDALRIHYRALGTPQRDENGTVRNAVLILHGTTGAGTQFLRPEFAGELFGKGQLLDAQKYFVVLPDGIGHGKSSKPSDGLHARFPHYGYLDMIEAQYRLLRDGLQVNHLRLVLGTSMGGMHTWLWGEEHPDFMDALTPLASLPNANFRTQSGCGERSASTRFDWIRAWNGGEYNIQPPSLRFVAGMLFLMGNNPVQR
jgi:homoserine O-acetyltransferase